MNLVIIQIKKSNRHLKETSLLPFIDTDFESPDRLYKMNLKIWKDHIPPPSRIKPTNVSIYVQNYNMSYILVTFLIAVAKWLPIATKEGRILVRSLGTQPSGQGRRGSKRVW